MQKEINEENKKLLKEFMPKDKVGIRVLNETQLENVFPSCDSLLQRIKKHRENISKIGKLEYTERDYQFDMMYDNVFSIFGKRGSGKTSTLLTLKMILKSQNHYDRILPLIIPDVIPENENILSWLMAILEDEVNSLECQLNSSPQNMNMIDSFFSDCKVEERNSLRNKFENIKKMSYSKSFRPEIMPSYYEALGGAEIKARNSYAFSKGLSQFWYEFVNTIIKIEKSEGKKVTPLIFIMFDDVDLSPERANELLSTIIKYLSHPNVIVITTADEDLFLKVVENNFKYNLNSSYSYMNCDKVKQSVRQAIFEIFYYANIENEEDKNNYEEEIMAKMYLDKVLPPSTRYFLSTFSDWNDKSGFLVEYSEGNNSLSFMMLKLIEKYIFAISPNSKQENNFLCYNDKFLNFYVSFFGNTSRQIQNQWIIMCEFLNSIFRLIQNKDNSYKQKLFNIINEFLYNSVNTNIELKNQVGDIKDFVNNVFYFEYSGYPFYVDYNYMSKKLQEESRSKDSEKIEILEQIKNAISLMALCAFVENILLILDKEINTRISNKREHLHLGRTLEGFIKWITKNWQIVKKEDSTEYMLYLYENFFEDPIPLIEFNLYNGKTVRNILMKLDMKAKKDSNIFLNFNNDWKNEKEFYTTYALMIFILYNNIYCIDEVFLNKVSFIDKVFDVPCRSSIVLSRVYCELVCAIVISEINSKNDCFNSNNVKSIDDIINSLSLQIKNTEEANNFTLGNAFCDTRSNKCNTDNNMYDFEIERLKEKISILKKYIVVDFEMYKKSIIEIENFFKDLNVLSSGKILRLLSKMKLENSIIIESEILKDFSKEIENFNKINLIKNIGILSPLIRNIYMSIDIFADEKFIVDNCVEHIKTIMFMHENYFNKMLDEEISMNVNSVRFYKQEILNTEKVASENWYQNLLEIMKSNLWLNEQIYQGVEEYIINKMTEED